MLDTVILNIPKSGYKILNPHRFSPPSSILEGNGNFLVRCVNNPTAQDKRDGIYKPRLTLIKRPTARGYDIPLKIEFSAPKLIFGNNLDELTETDFEKVISQLKNRLFAMDILVSEENLRQAKVSAFHASKNIKLTDNYTSSYVIKELQKVGLTKKLDLNKANFRNEGQSLQCYANSHSFVIYDKIKDLSKPKGRAIDKDQTSGQLTLFKLIKQQDQRLEIIRFEVRLSKKVKMSSLLSSLGYTSSPTFAEIFKQDLCKEIVSDYWQRLIANNQFLFDTSSDPQKILNRIIKNGPNIKPKQAVYLVGLNLLCKDKGIRELRSLLERLSTNRTWNRFAQDLKILNVIQSYDSHIEWIEQINQSIQEFSAYRTQLETKDPEVSSRGPAAYREDF